MTAPAQTGIVDQRGKVLPELLMDGSVQEYLLTTTVTDPDFVVRFQCPTDSWGFSTSVDGPFFHVASGESKYVAMRHSSLPVYVQTTGGGTLSAVEDDQVPSTSSEIFAYKTVDEDRTSNSKLVDADLAVTLEPSSVYEFEIIVFGDVSIYRSSVRWAVQLAGDADTFITRAGYEDTDESAFAYTSRKTDGTPYMVVNMEGGGDDTVWGTNKGMYFTGPSVSRPFAVVWGGSGLAAGRLLKGSFMRVNKRT